MVKDTKLTLLGSTALVALLLCLVSTWRSSVANQQIRLGGPLQELILEGKDFLADILPPPGFIVESNLKVNELLAIRDKSEQALRIEQLSSLAEQHEVCYQHWKEEKKIHAADTTSSSSTNSMLTTFTEDATKPALDYFQCLKHEFLPAIQADDFAKATAIYNAKLLLKYEAHSKAIGLAVEQAKQHLTICQAEAKAVTDAYNMWTTISVCSGFLTIATVVSLSLVVFLRSRKAIDHVTSRYDALDRVQVVIEFDPKGIVTNVNENFLKSLGYSRDEVIGKHHSMFVDPQYASSSEYRQFWSDLAAGHSQIAEIKRLTKSGKEIWINASYNPVLDSHGRVVAVVKFAIDTTAEKLERANLGGQIQAIGKSQAVIEFSMDGNILLANENFLNTLGYSLDEIKGRHHSMFVEPAYAQSAEYHRFWEDLKAGRYQSAEYKRIGKNGKEVWIQASYNPILDLNGRPFKVVKFASDVTATKLKNADYQSQLDAISKAQAVIEFDLDGTIRVANQNFLTVLGYSLEEIRGKHHSLFVEPSYSGSPEYRKFWEDLRSGTYQAAQYKRIGKGGKEVWIQASYNPIFDLNGKPYKVVKYASDITASKEMEFAIIARQKQDEENAIELRGKVKEILDVAAKVARRDYSQKLSVKGSDEIGKLGEGLAEFFAEKEATEIADTARSDRERGQAQEVERKVQVILKVVNSVADGNFNVTIPDMGNDPIGQVASALSVAVQAMKSALLEVQEVSGTVSTAATQLTEASRQISGGAQTQASSLEETASSLEEITSTVKQNTDNAQQARQLANGSRDVAERGGSVVSDAVQAMAQINQSSKRIADIITTIDEIAFQTNLLALNAAVEAARAGEQGRGFAVVAAEVRNLAQRSAGAAKEIKSLIQDSVSKVQNGTDLVNKSGATLGEIVTSVKRVTDIVSEIAAASKEQLTGIEQVNKAVSQMDRVTQGNATQTEEMSSTAGMLLSHAQRLSTLVGKFHLSGHAPQSHTEAQRSQSSGDGDDDRGTQVNRIPQQVFASATLEHRDLLEF